MKNQITIYLKLDFRFLYIIGLLFLMPQIVKGQTYTLNNDNIYEGFTRGLVKDIIIDERGYVWVASDGDLIRFDGKENISFKDKFEGEFFKSFYRRKNGKILLASDLGLSEIENTVEDVKINEIAKASNQYSDSTLYFPKSVFEDKKGRIWLAEEQGISLLEGDHLSKIPFDIEEIGFLNILKSFSIGEDDFGNIWAISFNGLLFKFNLDQQTFLHYPLEIDMEEVTSFNKIGGNLFWIGARNGVYELKIQQEGQIAYCKNIPGIDEVSCSLLIDDHFFIGTWKKGLYRNSIQNPNAKWEKINSLPFQEIVSISPGTNNSIWVASGEKIACLHPSFFKDIPLTKSHKVIETIEELHDGNLLASIGNDLFQVKKQAKNLTTEKLISFPTIPTSLLHENNKMLASGINGKVYEYNLINKKIKMVWDDPVSTKITQLFKDHFGNLFIGGQNNIGLVKIDKNRNIETFGQEEFKRTKVFCATSFGGLFIGGGGPDRFLFYYDSFLDKMVTIPVSLPFTVSNNFEIEDILLVKNNRLLLASSHGLLQYDFQLDEPIKGVLSRISLKKAPSNKPVHSLALSNDGTLWIATSHGLIASKNDEELLYDINSGLTGNNITKRGLVVGQDNNLWIATSNGLKLFQPKQQSDIITPPPVLTKFVLNGQEINYETNELLALPNKSSVTAQFQSLSFPINQLDYKSELTSKDYFKSNVRKDNFIILSDLKTGTYSLNIKAQQKGGYLWSKPLVINFTIQKPWYHNFWAITLLVISFLGVLYFTAIVYNRMLLHKNEKLEKVISLRTVELSQRKNEIIKQKTQIIQKNKLLRIAKEEQLLNELNYKNKQLTTYTLHIIQKNESLREFRKNVLTNIRQNKKKDTYAKWQPVLSIIENSFRKDVEWDNFKLYFEKVHVGFFKKLIKKHPSISTQDLRHCALIRLNLSITESATIFGISPKSIKMARLRLRKKMNLNSQQELIDEIMSI